MKHLSYRKHLLLMPLAGLSILCTNTQAEDITWNPDKNSGVFSDEANWLSGKVPTTSDTAIFMNSEAVSVEFKQDATVAKLRYEGSPTLTLNAAGSEVFINSDYMLASEGPDARRTLEIVNNSRLVLANKMFVVGDYSTVRLTEGSTLQIGRLIAGTATNRGREVEIYLSKEAKLTTGRSLSFIGNNSGNRASVFLDGPNTEWNTENASIVTIGGGGRPPDGGQGLLQISNQGSFSGKIINIGRNNAKAATFSGSGSLICTGNGSKVTAVELNIGGGRSQWGEEPIADGMGEAIFADNSEGAFDVVHVYHASESVQTNGALVVKQAKVAIRATATFDPSSILRAEFSPSTSTPLLEVSGTLQIADAILEVLLPEGLVPRAGQKFTLASYQTLEGNFQNLPQGAVLTAGKYQFVIDYQMDGETKIGLQLKGPAR